MLPELPPELWFYILIITSTLWLNDRGVITSHFGQISTVTFINPKLKAVIALPTTPKEWKLKVNAMSVGTMLFKG